MIILVVFEDGTMSQGRQFPEDWHRSIMDGIIQILTFSNAKGFQELIVEAENKWHWEVIDYKN